MKSSEIFVQILLEALEKETPSLLESYRKDGPSRPGGRMCNEFKVDASRLSELLKKSREVRIVAHYEIKSVGVLSLSLAGSRITDVVLGAEPENIAPHFSSNLSVDQVMAVAIADSALSGTFYLIMQNHDSVIWTWEPTRAQTLVNAISGCAERIVHVIEPEALDRLRRATSLDLLVG